MLGIPQKLGHIWIGDGPAPLQWMNTWRVKHPNWEYRLYDNTFLYEFNFKTHHQIKEYLKRRKFAGVADLMRLEILYEWGGFIPGADAICYQNTDELFGNTSLYTIYENEFLRGRLVSPIQAAPPKHPFIGHMIDRLSQIDPNDLDDPWISTGNWFTASMIEELSPEIIIFPSHYFIPVHYTGAIYTGDDKIYAKQLFGSTHRAFGPVVYGRASFMTRLITFLEKKKANQYNKDQIKSVRMRKSNMLNISFER